MAIFSVLTVLFTASVANASPFTTSGAAGLREEHVVSQADHSEALLGSERRGDHIISTVAGTKSRTRIDCIFRAEGNPYETTVKLHTKPYQGYFAIFHGTVCMGGKCLSEPKRFAFLETQGGRASLGVRNVGIDGMKDAWIEHKIDLDLSSGDAVYTIDIGTAGKVERTTEMGHCVIE